jgi:hypothetical protein
VLATRSTVIELSDVELAEALGTSLMRISCWRKKLNDPRAFENTYAAARGVSRGG